MAGIFSPQMLSPAQNQARVQAPVTAAPASPTAGVGQAIGTLAQVGVGLARQHAQGSAVEEAERIGESLVNQLQSDMTQPQPSPERNATVSEAMREAERLSQASRLRGRADQFQNIAQARMKEMINRNPLFKQEIVNAFASVLGKDSTYGQVLQQQLEADQQMQKAGAQQLDAYQTGLEETYGLKKDLMLFNREAYMQAADILTSNNSAAENAARTKAFLEGQGIPPSKMMAERMAPGEAAAMFQNIPQMVASVGLPNYASNPQQFITALQGASQEQREAWTFALDGLKAQLRSGFQSDSYNATLEVAKINNMLKPMEDEIDRLKDMVDNTDVLNARALERSNILSQREFEMFSTDPKTWTYLRAMGKAGLSNMPSVQVDIAQRSRDAHNAYFNGGGTSRNGAGTLTVPGAETNTTNSQRGDIIKLNNETFYQEFEEGMAPEGMGDMVVSHTNGLAYNPDAFNPAELKEMYAITTQEDFLDKLAQYPEADQEQAKQNYLRGLANYGQRSIANAIAQFEQNDLYQLEVDPVTGLFRVSRREGVDAGNDRHQMEKLQREVVDHLNTVAKSGSVLEKVKVMSVTEAMLARFPEFMFEAEPEMPEEADKEEGRSDKEKKEFQERTTRLFPGKPGFGF